MMRWVIFSVVVVALAGIATVASTYMSTGTPLELIPTGQVKQDGPPGSAFVDGPLSYNFGVMSQQTEGSHEWTITNKGTGDLALEKGESTCSCTIANLEDGATATLAPGKSTKVRLDWNTKGNDGKFSQHATVLVNNDPEHQKLDFQITGTVHPAIMTMPPEPLIEYRDESNDQPHPRELILFSIDRPETKFVEATTSNPELLAVAIAPLTAVELTRLKEYDISKGSKLVLSIKPGASIGAFAEELIVATDHPEKPKFTMKVAGRLTGPITITPDRVRLLDVASRQGDSQTLILWVRGQKSTRFTVDKKPKDVDVRIVPMGASGAENATRYQLTVKVPAGTRPGDITDEIILKTDHPHASELKIPIAVLVRAS